MAARCAYELRAVNSFCDLLGLVLVKQPKKNKVCSIICKHRHDTRVIQLLGHTPHCAPVALLVGDAVL